jgi:hypothetical protein
MIEQLIFGYDVMTYNGEQPNCLNPKFLGSISRASDFRFDQSGPYFRERWGDDWAVYNSNYLSEYTNRKSIFEIIKDREKKGIRKQWFYVVEPFGNFEKFFGIGSSIHSQLALEFISKTAIEEIKNYDGNLVISYFIDGGLGVNKENFEKIFNFIDKNEIPDEKVYFIFQDFKLKKNIEKLGRNVKVLDYNQALIAKSQEFLNTLTNPNFSYWNNNDEPQVGKIESTKNSVVTTNEFTNSIGKDKKDFLFLCRHWKPHRIKVLYDLWRAGLDNFLVSWDNKFYSQQLIDEHRYMFDDDAFIDLVKNTSNHLDIDDLTKIAGYGFENKDIYLNSYMSIVTESIFFQTSHGHEDKEFATGYLSEKIWKPIGHCQPFILLGPAKSLEYIRSLGFKTFDGFIDESYDLETKDSARMYKTIHEIMKFHNKSKEEKDEFLKNVKEICVYNQQHFLSFSKNHKQEQSKMINFLLQGENTLI